MSHIYPPIRQALAAMIEAYNPSGSGGDAEAGNSVLLELVPVFTQVGDFRKKLEELDTLIEKFPQFDLLEPYLFDLLILSFIVSDSAKLPEDYLDSPEWLAIEDETADRGSELLNVYLYLSETAANKMRPDLEDYLHEFLLTEDELYQDEFFIYEEIIRNASLIDSGISEWLAVASGIESEGIREIFVPLFAFFSGMDSQTVRQQLKENKQTGHLDLALYNALCAYQAGLKEVEMHE